MIYDTFPFTPIIRYVADQLDADGIMPKTITLQDGFEMPTIIPIQQEKELNDTLSLGDQRQTPMIVYSIEHLPDRYEKDYYWKDGETITFHVFSPNVNYVNKILYRLRDLFDKADWSAERLNDHDQDGVYRYLFTSYKYMMMAEPTNQEGGRYYGQMTIYYEYINNNIVDDPSSLDKGLIL